MPSATKHNTVETRILAYTQEVDSTVVFRVEADQQNGFGAAAAHTTPFRTLLHQFMTAQTRITGLSDTLPAPT